MSRHSTILAHHVKRLHQLPGGAWVLSSSGEPEACIINKELVAQYTVFVAIMVLCFDVLWSMNFSAW